ncbi:exocyst complex component EXO70B1-like [Arachis ipaensis]|uniref:exocyst complex component EXO70B1-like n=1 Tax=Arachis ipaensis TaxID=130454 RepID=UPI0007AFB924|nr:exocyst complex component EXO70B1-like [Arachis ipaensis]XP_025667675.1 exocyst complex component EXO70B1 [Arachis hypogaea]
MNRMLRPLLTQIHSYLMQPRIWRLLGFASTLIGFICYALSSSFYQLFGSWTLFKIVAYSIFSIIICLIILFPKLWQQLRGLNFEAHMAFFVLIITSVYSYFSDKAMKGKPDAYSVTSYAAFAVTSLSLQRQNAPAKNRNQRFQDKHHLVVQVNMNPLQVNNNINNNLVSSNIPQKAQQPDEHVAVEANILPSMEERRWANLAVVNMLKCNLTKYIQDKVHRIPEILINDHNFLIDELPSQLVSDLHEKVKLMVRTGFEKECVDQYCTWRREFLDLAGKELSIQEIEEKRRIKTWIKVSNVSLKILFPNERRLCDRIFLGFPSVADCSFAQICGEFTTNLLDFANGFANGSHMLNLLPSVLQVFGALHELIPEFESVFLDQFSVSLRSEAATTGRRLRKAINGMFMQLEKLINCDTSQVACPGGICPVTVEVMNQLSAVGEFGSSWLSAEVTRIIALLESHLEAKSKDYSNPALGFVFLMNNERYIEKKAKQYQLDKILGNHWIRQRAAKVRENCEHYRRSSWEEVLGFLKLSTEQIEEAESMKKKLNLFNLRFKEIWMDQSAWFMHDEELREEIIASLRKILSHTYGLFIWSFNRIHGKDAHECIKYSVLDIEDLLKDLFGWRDEQLAEMKD